MSPHWHDAGRVRVDIHVSSGARSHFGIAYGSGKGSFPVVRFAMSKAKQDVVGNEDGGV